MAFAMPSVSSSNRKVLLQKATSHSIWPVVVRGSHFYSEDFSLNVCIVRNGNRQDQTMNFADVVRSSPAFV
jgi:hypothetical protein